MKLTKLVYVTIGRFFDAEGNMVKIEFNTPQEAEMFAKNHNLEIFHLESKQIRRITE